MDLEEELRKSITNCLKLKILYKGYMLCVLKKNENPTLPPNPNYFEYETFKLNLSFI